MRRILFAIALALALPATALTLAGCPSSQQQVVTPKQTLAGAESTFTAVVTGLAAARDAGAIAKGSPLEAEITKGITTGDSALDAAQAALRGNDSAAFSQWLSIAQAAIAELQKRLAQTKGD